VPNFLDGYDVYGEFGVEKTESICAEEKNIKLSLNVNSLCATLDFVYSIQNSHKCSLMEAMLMFAESSNLEVEELAELLKKDKNFVESLRVESMKNNSLRQTDGFISKPTLEKFF
jgi:hypothetical protein